MFINHIAYALPSWKVSSKKIAEWSDGEVNFLQNKVGINNRYYLAEDETLSGLACDAVKNLNKKCPEMSLSQIDLLVLITQNPDYRIPHSSALIQNQLGLSKETACFDISLGCSGWVYGLTAVKGFMMAQNINEALILTCDPYSRVIGRSDKATVSVFGDAATACWFSSDGIAEIGIADFGTDGSGAEHLMVKSGGSAFPQQSVLSDEVKSYPYEDLRLYMNGRKILEFMLTVVPGSIDNCLNKNKLSAEDIDLYVFHQASKYMIFQLTRILGLQEDKVPIDVSDVGNTVSSSIPIMLSKLAEEGKLKGKTVLISGFGVGLSWATNILRFD